MVKTYAKGYRSERELLHILDKYGFVVMRSPRSGRIGLAAPDVVAIKNGCIIVVECKSHKDAFRIREEQLQELKEWEEKGGAQAFVGWKRSRRGWSFIKLEDAVLNSGRINHGFADEKGIGLSGLVEIAEIISKKAFKAVD